MRGGGGDDEGESEVIKGDTGGAHEGEEVEELRKEGTREEGFEEGVVEERVFGGKRVEDD